MSDIISRDIQREDLYINYQDQILKMQITKVRLWTNHSSNECDRFNVQLKIDNNDADDKIADSFLDGGSWTVIAHSDHNPDGGHDIRCQSDRKQLHIDIHPYDNRYTKVYDKICNGNPPQSNNKAIKIITRYMRSNTLGILKQFIQSSNH